MGRRELLEALQHEGRETMAAIAAKRAAREEELRAAAAKRCAEQQQAHAKELELLCNSRKQTLIAKAAREVALIRLRAEHALAVRLQERALYCLGQLRSGDSGELFHALVAELPAMSWHTIWTAPGDTTLATACFPGAAIIPDPAIVGGLKVATAEGSLTIDNTLGKRLETLWPELLPMLLAELREGSP